MARTFTAGERTNIAAAHADIFGRLEITDPDGTWRDVSTALSTPDWFDGATLSESLDANCQTFQATLLRETGALSLAPLMTASTINRNGGGTYAPMLDVARQWRLSIAVPAHGVAPLAGDWKVLGQGYIDTVHVSGDRAVITIAGRDLGAKLLDTYITTERQYGASDAAGTVAGTGGLNTFTRTAGSWTAGTLVGARVAFYNGTTYVGSFAITGNTTTVLSFTGDATGATTTGTSAPMEAVIQELLNDNLGVGVVTLYTPVSPSFAITPVFTQAKDSLMNAINQVAALAGFVCKYRFDASDVFRLTLYQPNRSAVVADWVLGPTEYLAVPLNTIDASGVRNTIVVRYPDLATGTVATATSTNAGSVTRYGTRAMQIDLSAKNQIQDATRAQAFAGAICADLASPVLEQRFETFAFWLAQLGDYGQFTQNGVQYDTDQYGGVTAIHHTFANGSVRTVLDVRGKPAGRYATWLGMGAADLGVTWSLVVRTRVTASTATTVTVRVAVADPYPQGTNSATIAYVQQGTGGVTPASPGSVTPAATLTEAVGTYTDYTVTRPAFGTGTGRVTFTATATGRTTATDAVDVPAQERDTVALLARCRVTTTSSTAVTVRVAVADPYPQGLNSAAITYQDLGSGGVAPASGGTVTPEATITENAGTYIEYTITRAAAGSGTARVTFTATAASRLAAVDAVDVPCVESTLGGLGGEPALGNPAADGDVLASTMAGARSWVAKPASLSAVENTALSTWAGTTSVTTLGTITSGTWHGTAIDHAYLSGITAADIAAGTFPGASYGFGTAPVSMGALTAAGGTLAAHSVVAGLGYAVIELRDSTVSSYYPALMLEDSAGSPLLAVRNNGSNAAPGFQLYSYTSGGGWVAGAVAMGALTATTGTLSGNLTIGPNGTLWGAKVDGGYGPTPLVAQYSFGYNPDYKVTLVGSTGTSGASRTTISLGQDTGAISGGSFSGDGSEIVVRRTAKFIIPNSGATDWETLFSWSGGGLAVAKDVWIGSLGRIDSTKTPTTGQLLAWDTASAGKWAPTTVQLGVNSGVAYGTAQGDGTTAAYFNSHPTLSGTPVAPTAAPVTTIYYHAIAVDMSARPLLAGETYVLDYSTNGGAYTVGAIVSTGPRVVHSNLDPAKTYAYKFFVRGASDSAYSPPTGALTPSTYTDNAAFGLVAASQVACVNLAALAADIGDLGAGRIHDPTNTVGILLGGYSLPSWTTYLNLTATGANPILHHASLDLKADGSATFSGTVTVLATWAGSANITTVGTVSSGSFPAGNLSGATLAAGVTGSSLTGLGTVVAGRLQDSATAPKYGVLVSGAWAGATPSVSYLDLTATGTNPVLRHMNGASIAFQLLADGSMDVGPGVTATPAAGLARLYSHGTAESPSQLYWKDDGGHEYVVGMRVIKADTFTGNGTWTRDSRAVLVIVHVWGGGGGGGAGTTSTSLPVSGGTGGGGGAYCYAEYMAASLPASIPVTVGAGGSGGATAGAGGGGGNLSSFGSYLSARGGGGGCGAGTNTGNYSGGGGGGVLTAGGGGAQGSNAAGGAPVGYEHGGAASQNAGNGGFAIWGGASGGGAGVAPSAGAWQGGVSFYGGGGGGAGGYGSPQNVAGNGVAGGASGGTGAQYGGGGAGGAGFLGAGGSATAGTAGASSTAWYSSGAGGGGGGCAIDNFGACTVNGGAGGVGGTPGGGGGGGGSAGGYASSTLNVGAGGAGGPGRVIIYQLG